MPELPEVETVRTALEPLMAGATIAELCVADPLLSRPHEPHELEGLLRGQRIERLGRRGKYLVFHLDGGHCWLVHLRMTGRILLSPERPTTGSWVALDSGLALVWQDTRRFGRWEVLAEEDLEGRLQLGPEPLDFSAGDLSEALARRPRMRLKGALLDQSLVAGIGNIYADEALWASQLHPLRAAGSLDPEETARLHAAIRAALLAGLAAGGASISDYRRPDGTRGDAQLTLQVYGRAGGDCPRCGATLIGLRVAGRGTTICPSCQPAPASKDSAPHAGRSRAGA